MTDTGSEQPDDSGLPRYVPPGPVPPGAAPAGQVPPGHGPPPVPPQFAVPQAGPIPLRPLLLGDIYNAAFKVIRYNLQATIGFAALVAAIAMMIPVVVAAAVSLALDLTYVSQFTFEGDEDLESLGGYALATGSMLGGYLLMAIGSIAVVGLVAQVVLAAVKGRRVGIAEAWAATRGQRWRLVGLTLLPIVVVLPTIVAYAATWFAVAQLPVYVWVLYALASFAAFLTLGFWAYVRWYYLAPAALIIERTTVFGAIRRAGQLSRGRFWPLFGIMLLTQLIVGFAAGMVSIPFSLGAELVPLLMGESPFAITVNVALNALGVALASAFSLPFVAAVSSIQYVDQRIRNEGFDVELIGRA